MKDNEVKLSSPNLENTTLKRKKRQRTSTVSETEEKDTRLQYERDYAEGFIRLLSDRLDETTYIEVLTVLQNFEANALTIEEFQNKMDSLLKNHDDLKWKFLAFLKPSHTLDCGRLMDYLNICEMKEFVLKLMLHFKKQPHLFRKVIEKLCDLVENENLQLHAIEENVAPFLSKNSDLMRIFQTLLLSDKPLDKYFIGEDIWEEFNVDNDVMDEETFDASHLNDIIPTESSESKNKCLYGCKNKSNTSACIVCDIKYINGRMYVANGKVLKPANIIFDPSEEKEQTIRLCGKNDFEVSSTSRPTKVHKRADPSNKESHEGGLSPFILGTESEDEIGYTEMQPRSKKSKPTRGLKIRFKSKKKLRVTDSPVDQPQTDDTAPSNDDGSCDDTSKEDNDYNSCDECFSKKSNPDQNLGLPAKEIVMLEDMEFNISTCAVSTNRNSGESRRTPDSQKPKNLKTNLI
ncbi:uncharacterized protein LOC135836263 [Planococcus citri]|uniref:uncharacterized protein LOC135836263 n=1 Tax=Planococcus citri TaxID=170843 RepID=UPI0031F72E96